ncbi:MAG: PQQ-binding-like beta-propeller repeat protein, partial [Pseudomonadota bacterium]
PQHPTVDGVEAVNLAIGIGHYDDFAVDGRVLWNDSAAAARRADALAGIADVRAAPVIDREMVLVVSASDRMIALDRRIGDRLWEREIGGVETPWAGGDYFFMITSDNELICIDRIDGGVVWVRKLPRFEDEADREGRILWRGPLLASDRLIVAGSHGEMWAVSPYDGRVLGVQNLDAQPAAAPIVANGALHVLTLDGRLNGFR